MIAAAHLGVAPCWCIPILPNRISGVAYALWRRHLHLNTTIGFLIGVTLLCLSYDMVFQTQAQTALNF